jgi:hypothetical protein
MDKTYIEALMSAPSHPEHDMTLREAMQSKAFKKKFGRTLAYVIACWRRINVPEVTASIEDDDDDDIVPGRRCDGTCDTCDCDIWRHS